MSEQIIIECLEERLLLSHTWQGFLPEQEYATGLRPVSVICADFDGDNNIDLAVTNNLDNTVSILTGNGNGTFDPKQDFAAGTAPHGLACEDFNGDGFLDLVVGHGNGSDIAVLWGGVDPMFSAPQTLAAGSNSFGLTIGDVNNDSRPDIVTVNRNDNTVSVILRNSNGTFAAKQDLATGGIDPVAVRIADVNGDNKMDLVVANEGSATITLLRGNTPGTFLAAVEVYDNRSTMAIDMRDVNGDANLDIVLASYSGNYVETLLGNGAGVFTSAGLTFVTHGLALAVGDVDHDDELDVLTSRVQYALGNGDGTFDAPQTVATSNRVDTIAMADFNEDGWLDAVAANYNEDNISVLLNTGQANIPPVAVDDALVVHKDSPIGVLVNVVGNDTDADGDTLSALILTPPSHGTIMLVGSDISYRPDAGYSGPDSLTYTVNDAWGGSDIGTLNIKVLEPVVVGDAAAKKATFTDADQTVVSVTHKGGTATLWFFGDSVQSLPSKSGVTITDADGRVELYEIDLNSATAKGATTVTTSKGGDGLVAVSEITGGVAVAKIKAKTTDLIGQGVALTGVGYVQSLTIHDLKDNAGITMPGNGAAKPLTIIAGEFAGANYVNVGSPIGTFRVAQTNAGQITSPSIGKLTVAGDKKRLTPLAGNFGTSLVVGSGGRVIGSVNIAGGMDNSAWAITGGIGTVKVAGRVSNSRISTSEDIKSITFGAIRDANILAGVPAQMQHAAAHGDFTPATVKIGTVTIKGISGADKTERFTERSSISAGVIGRVNLLNMESTAAGNFGIFAYDAAGQSEITRVTVKDKIAPADKTKNWNWSTKTAGDPLNKTVDQFVIRVL